MNVQRKEGILHFREGDWNEELAVLWKVKSGEIAEGQTWQAVISFTREWGLPRKTKDLVDLALHEETVTMQLQISKNVIVDCTIHEIEDFWDYDALRIGSPDLGRAMMYLSYPNSHPPPIKKPVVPAWLARLRTISRGLGLALMMLILLACAAIKVGDSHQFPLEQHWSFEADSNFGYLSVSNEGPVVTRNTTFNIFQASYLAIDRTTGDLLWQEIVDSSYGVGNKQLQTKEYLFLSGSGVKAMNLTNGKTEWQAGNAGDARAMTTTAGMIFVARKGRVTALDIATGKELWINDSFPGVGFAVFYDELTERLVVAPHISDFTLLSPHTGQIIEQVDVKINCQIIPLRIHEGRLYCGSISYDASRGQFLRDYGFRGDNFTWYPPHDSHTILVATPLGTVGAISISSGNLIWEYKPLTIDDEPIDDAPPEDEPTPGKVALNISTLSQSEAIMVAEKSKPLPVRKGSSSAKVISNIATLGSVGYVIVNDGTLRAFDLESGQEIGWWQGPTPNYTSSVISDGEQLYASFGGKTLYAFSAPE